MRVTPRYVCAGVAAALLVVPSFPAAGGPNATDKRDLAGLSRRVKGFVVWESNRSGAWELYRIDTDGSGFTRITSLEKQLGRTRYDRYLRPRVSPDGKTVLFGYCQRRSPCEVWVVPSTGGTARKLTTGTPLNWSPAGRVIYFARAHRVWQRDFRTGAEKKVNDVHVPPDGKDGNMVGAVRRDLGAAVFRTGRNEYVDFRTHKVEKTTRGCEPGFTSDGAYMYWVNGPKHFAVWHIARNKEWEYFRTPPTDPHNYTYFPTISTDSRWLTYGASPGQHNHTSSDYEIYIQELEDWKPVGSPVRLSWHGRTDRWPYLYVNRDGTPPSVPAGFTAWARGQAVTLNWSAAKDRESGVSSHVVYRDGAELARVESGTTYIDRATDANTQYAYQVAAVNGSGLTGGRTRAVKARTRDAAPVAPTGLRASAGSRQSVALSWDGNPERDIVEYRVYRAEGTRGAPKRVGLSTETTWTDTRAGGGKAYRYSVSAVDRRRTEGAKSGAVTGRAGAAAGEGACALYLFDEGRGATARDSSGAELGLDLTFADRRRIRWVEGGGVEFAGPTVAKTSCPARALIRLLRKTNAVTIEAVIQTADTSQKGPARIVSLSGDPGRRNFTLGQEGPRPSFRLRTSRTDTNGIPQLDAGVLAKRPTHVACTFDGRTKRVYVDGKLQPQAQDVGGDFSGWSDFSLQVGNEATGDRPWRGTVFRVAIYDRALSAREVAANATSSHTR